MNEAQALAPVSFIKGGRMKKLKVYLAGPISKGDRGHNLAQFISWHEYLMTAGFAVFNPGLSMLLPWAADKSHSQWMEADIPFVLQSDLVVRLPGESVGADQEVAEAMKAGIPVYFAPEKPEDKPRSLSLERFVREAKALVSDGYVFVDPSKSIENGTMYRLLHNYGDTFSVSKAQAFGSGVRTGLAIAVKLAEAKSASPRPEVAAGTAVIEVKQPGPKFKPGDRVQIIGPSTMQFYSGPFPADGTVKKVYERTCDVVLGFNVDHRRVDGFTFRNENLKPVEEPAKPVKKGPKFKEGDTVTVIGWSAAGLYKGPFPVTGIVRQVFGGHLSESAYGIRFKKANGIEGSFCFFESALAQPAYPQTIQAHGVDWHLATAADIGKPCYMMFPLNNPPGALPKIQPSELGHTVWKVHPDGRVVSDCGSKAPAAYVPDQVPVKKEVINPGDFVYITGKSIAGHDQRKGTVQKVSSVAIKCDKMSGHDRTIPAWVKPGHRALGPDDTIQKGDLAIAVGNGYLAGNWVPVSDVIGMKADSGCPNLIYQRPMRDLKPQPAWVPGGYVEVKPGEVLDQSQVYICNATDNERNPDGSYVRSTGWIEFHLAIYEPGGEERILVARKVTKADTDASAGPAKPRPSAVDFGPFTPVVVGAPGSVFAIPQPGQDHPAKGKAPDPGHGFRLLHPDEQVKEGDEVKRSWGWDKSINWRSVPKCQAPEFWYRRPNSSAVTEAVTKAAPAAVPEKKSVADAKGQAIQVGDTVKILVDISLGGAQGMMDQIVKVEKISEWCLGGGVCVEASVPGHLGRKAFRPDRVEIVKPVHQLPADYIGPVTVDGRTMRLAVPGDEGKKAWAGFPDRQPGRSGGLVWIVKSIARDCKATLTPDSTWSTVPDIFPAAWVVDEPEPVPASQEEKATGSPSEKQTEQPTLKKFSTGAVRSSDADDTRFDLVSPLGLERLARTCAEGARKYGDHNWTKGMPVSECLNHCLRHINMYLEGDQSEDHLAHAAWNLFAVMHFEKVKPDLVDVPTRKEKK